MTPEGKIKKKVKDLLNKYGCYWFMPVASLYSRKGMPDFVCCYKDCVYNGRFIGIETKAKGKVPTELQKLERDKIEGAGGRYFLISDEEDIKDLEEELKGLMQ